VICPECHNHHDDAGLYSYCAQCWAFDLDDSEKAKIIETAEFAKRKACPQCGSRRTETFCGQCGHRVKPMTLRQRVAASCRQITKTLLAPTQRITYEFKTPRLIRDSPSRPFRKVEEPTTGCQCDICTGKEPPKRARPTSAYKEMYDRDEKDVTHD